jgi:hypothetical protein
MCAFKMMATCSNVVRGGATLYFVKYVMDHPEMATQFLLYGSLATMFGSLCSSRLLGRFDRSRRLQVDHRRLLADQPADFRHPGGAYRADFRPQHPVPVRL